MECDTEDIELDFNTLKNELKKHNPQLAERPSLLLLTKVDLIPDEMEKEENISVNIPIIQISSVTGKNLIEAVQSISKLIQSQTHAPEIITD